MTEREGRSAFPPTLTEKVTERMRLRVNTEFTGRLPSMNELAKQNGVSRPTMIKALQALKAEGLLETRQGSGTYIAGALKRRTREVGIFFEPDELTEPQTREPEKPMTIFDVYLGLRLYTWTNQRLREIDYAATPTETNKEKLMEAAGRVVILDKIAEEIEKNPSNLLLRFGMVNAFKQEITEIRKAPTLGDALLQLTNTNRPIK